MTTYVKNKGENVHRFAPRFMEREIERERERIKKYLWKLWYSVGDPSSRIHYLPKKLPSVSSL